MGVEGDTNKAHIKNKNCDVTKYILQIEKF